MFDFVAILQISIGFLIAMLALLAIDWLSNKFHKWRKQSK